MSSALSIQHRDDDCRCCDILDRSNNKQTEEEATFADSGIVKEMNELTQEKREQIYEDIHGVANYQEETPEFVQEHIQALDKAISFIPLQDRTAYNTAMFLKPRLQTDVKFKLKFLRAEEFNDDKAAVRMVKYFELQLSLFGEDKLVKRLTMDDLTEDEIRFFKIGYMGELPFKDRIGRPIIFGDGSKRDFTTMKIDSIIRAFWYMRVTCFEDETAQKKGVCTLMHYDSKRHPFSKVRELSKRLNHAITCLPGRNTSFHVVHADARIELVFNTLRLGLVPQIRHRLRAHYGTEMENEYKLMSFGISPQGLLQKAKRGDLSLFEDSILLRRNGDKKAMDDEAEEEASTGIIAYPQPNDVLIGRGKAFKNLTRNSVWEKAIQSNFERYRDSTAFEKTCISMDIVKTTIESGARFLERSDNGWIALDEVAARRKTATAFRNRARDLANLAKTSSQQSAGQKTAATNAGIGGQAPKRQRFDPVTQMQEEATQQQQRSGFFFRW